MSCCEAATGGSSAGGVDLADSRTGSVRHLADAVAAGVGGERRAVLVGIVLGEDEGLGQELQDNFRASGLYHLLAVSGQNVAFVAGAMIGLAWLLGLPGGRAVRRPRRHRARTCSRLAGSRRSFGPGWPVC